MLCSGTPLTRLNTSWLSKSHGFRAGTKRVKVFHRFLTQTKNKHEKGGVPGKVQRKAKKVGGQEE